MLWEESNPYKAANDALITHNAQLDGFLLRCLEGWAWIYTAQLHSAWKAIIWIVELFNEFAYICCYFLYM